MTAYPDLVHQYALAYIQRGIPVFPVRVTPDGVKFPAIKGGHGHLDATTDTRTIDGWFGPDGAYRGCGIGGYLAKATPPMAAIDIDVKNGGAGPEQYSSLQAQHGALADTVRVLTPTGGWHDWVTMNGHRIGSTNGGLPNSPDIDIKGVGGWVVLPPTRLADGREYAFEEGHKPSEIATAVDPGWIASLCPAKLEGEGGGRWRELDRTQLHPLDLRALEALEELGGHDPFIGGDGCVHISRPGKSAGTSASIGYLGPGIVGVRSPNWPGLAGPERGKEMRVYVFDDLKVIHTQATAPTGRLVAISADTVKVKRVRWLWDGRLALGTIALLAGPEGLGKSTFAYTIAALLTRGKLLGEFYGTPKAVLVSATEDSWEHTIVPRLMAAGADLARIYRVEAKLADDILVGLSLPDDLHGLAAIAESTGAALLLLDPLMSRLDASLDTHRDGDVRRALEPLKALAEQSLLTIWGLIHHNKGGGSDPLQLVMASKAFTAVARSVHTVIKDPEEDSDRRLFGTTKNNLGRIDLPTLGFTIESWSYPTEDGDGMTGRLEWAGETKESISDLMAKAQQDPEQRSAEAEAIDWLREYMLLNGPRVASAEAKSNAHRSGITERTLKRAMRNLKLTVEREGFPAVTYWISPSEATLARSPKLGPTGPTVKTTSHQDTSGAKSSSWAKGVSPQEIGPPESAPDEDARSEWAKGACAFVGGSLWCVRDPCPNPHHRVRPA